MKSKELAKIKSLAQELVQCVDAYEGGDMAAEDDNSPEPKEDGGSDMAAKSLKMKLGKYKEV